MKNAPVYYALSQAKFNPVANIGSAKYINEIQDQLRLKGYTLFELRNFAKFQLSNTSESSHQISQATQWVISKENRTSGFILTDSSLTYHTTHYETRHEFIDEFMSGLEIVHGVVKLAHLNRLGLRYLNAVLPLSDELVSQYLVSGLHGIDFKADREYTFNEALFKTKSSPLLSDGKLVLRVLQLASSLLGYPPDLLPQGLIQSKRFEIKEPCSHALIDTDHFVEGHMPVDFNKIKDQLFSLQAVNKEAFESTVTDYARRVWD